LVAACTPNTVALGPNEFEAEPGSSEIGVEVARERVSIVQAGQEQEVPLTEQVSMQVGQSVVLDETGRAILQFGDLLTLEIFQGGQVEVQEFSPDRVVIMAAAPSGGTAVADLTATTDPDTRVDIQTTFGTVSATNGRFAMVHGANSPLAWVLGLEAIEGDVQIKAGNRTQAVTGGQAYWITAEGEIGPTVTLTRGVEAWLNGVRNNATQPQLGEILLPPANVAIDSRSINRLPPPGEPLELINEVQGIVKLTLDPEGIFGSPIYSLVDCNSDGAQDLAIQNGVLVLDFSQVLARVQGLDVAIFNRDQPGTGLLKGLDPAGIEIDQQQLQVGEGLLQTLSLRADQPYHLAELAVSDACFLGVTLTPPGSNIKPVEAVQPILDATQGDTVINILETTSQRSPDNGQFQAPAVGVGPYAGLIEIDGARADWDALVEQSGLEWTSFSTITHDAGCAARFPGPGDLADLAGKVNVAYDERYLYVAFEVNDDGLVSYTGADDRYFLGDSTQLLLDLDLNSDLDVAQLSADDVQVDLLPDINAPKAVLWRLSVLSSSQLAGTLMAVMNTETGYFVEAAIPWRELNLRPQPGDRLGLVASINDNDTPETNAQECIISTSPRRDWRDPTTWGTVLLLPANGN
jgi:hypothetical protein